LEVSALKHAGVAGLHGRSPLLRLQSDERLVALVRRGNHSAFEALVGRYQARLLAFCRHMLGSREDAEDVLQEVFAAAFNAILGDEREINVRPWLYRIARNRSLNHLRRAQAVGVDSMDVHLSEHGATTADKVHKREEFRMLVADVQELPETQRTALLLREIDALSYEQIAEAMETTVPSVKSLLVRARVSLAEAAEARQLSCDEVRIELGEVAEGLARTSAPVRRHLRNCERCATFRKQLRQTNKALAAILPVGPLFLLKKSLLAHLGTTAAASSGAAAASGGAAAGGVAAGGALQAGISTVATKAAAGLAAAAIVTAGAVEVKHVTGTPHRQADTVMAATPKKTQTPARPAAPVAVGSEPQPVTAEDVPVKVVPAKQERTADSKDKKADPEKRQATTDPKTGGVKPPPDEPTEQRERDATTLPNDYSGSARPNGGALGPQDAPPPAQSIPVAQQEPTPIASSPPPEQTAAPQPTPQPQPQPTPVTTAPPASPPAYDGAPQDDPAAPKPTPTPTPAPDEPVGTPQPGRGLEPIDE
jgi:RNA polymerase sigma factor (sigma-70 family)